MFLPHKTAEGKVIPWEYLPCSAITPKVGMTLYQTSGQLAIAASTTKPTYICMAEYGAAVTAGTLIPVIRIDDETIFETTNQAAFISGTTVTVKPGDKVTIYTGGLQVTATKDSGVAEVVGYEDTAAGSKVWVRFK